MASFKRRGASIPRYLIDILTTKFTVALNTDNLQTFHRNIDSLSNCPPCANHESTVLIVLCPIDYGVSSRFEDYQTREGGQTVCISLKWFISPCF